MSVKAGSKYVLLHTYLRSRAGDNVSEIAISFAQIEQLIGSALPSGARQGRAWWGNRASGSAQANAWLQAGYRVDEVDLSAQQVIFIRAPQQRASYTIAREGAAVSWDAMRIKSLRQHMGLNQAQFAETLGVRQQTVSEWEVGVYEPTRATCKHLALVAEQVGYRYGDAGP